GAGLHRDVAVEAEHAAEQFGAKAAHHREHDDQGADSEHDAEEGERGDDRDEAFLTTRAQVSPGNHSLDGSEHQAVSRAITASGASSRRSPVARRFSSTTPCLTPRGPITACQGSPIRSIVANLAPALSSRSSTSTSRPARSSLAARSSAAASQAGSPARRLITPTANGATGSGQTMPDSTWNAAIRAPKIGRASCRERVSGGGVAG